MAATPISEKGALTAADLHLDGDDSDDDDESECTDRTDDDSFLANNSITKMMKHSFLMLDSLTDEMQKELARGDDEKKVSRTASSNGTTSQNVRVVTPSSATSTLKGNERPDNKRFQDMTISIEFDNRKGQASQSATSTSANESVLTASSPMASPLTSPIYASTIKNTVGAMKVPTLADTSTPQNNSCRTRDHESHDDDDDDDDDLSLDDSLANEMNALKEVALELNRELQSADTVQKAIERIGNSRDPKVQSVLESDDKVVLRQMLHEEMRRQKSWTLTEDEMTQLLTAVAGAVWSVVLGLLIRAMTMEVMV